MAISKVTMGFNAVLVAAFLRHQTRERQLGIHCVALIHQFKGGQVNTQEIPD